MSKELQVPHTMMHLFAYKVLIVLELKPDGKPYLQNCTMHILHQNNLNPGCLLSVFISDEAMFLQSRSQLAQKILTASKSSLG